MEKDLQWLLAGIGVAVMVLVLLVLAFSGADITGCTVQKGFHL